MLLLDQSYELPLIKFTVWRKTNTYHLITKKPTFSTSAWRRVWLGHVFSLKSNIVTFNSFLINIKTKTSPSMLSDWIKCRESDNVIKFWCKEKIWIDYITKRSTSWLLRDERYDKTMFYLLNLIKWYLFFWGEGGLTHTYIINTVTGYVSTKLKTVSM